MDEIALLFPLGTQYMVRIKGLPALDTFGVIIGVDREATWRMRL
jgi:hypothetical protein